MVGIWGQVTQGPVYVRFLPRPSGEGVQGNLELTSKLPRGLINSTLRKRTKDPHSPGDG